MNKYQSFKLEPSQTTDSNFLALSSASSSACGSISGRERDNNNLSLDLYNANFDKKYSTFDTIFSNDNDNETPDQDEKFVESERNSIYSKSTDAAILFTVQTFKTISSRTLLIYQVPEQLSNYDLINLFSTYGDVHRMYIGRKLDMNILVLSYYSISDTYKALKILSSETFPVKVQFCYDVIGPEESSDVGYVSGRGGETEIEDTLRRDQKSTVLSFQRLIFININLKEFVKVLPKKWKGELNERHVADHSNEERFEKFKVKVEETEKVILLEFYDIRDCNKFLRDIENEFKGVQTEWKVIREPLSMKNVRLGNSLYAFIKGDQYLKGQNNKEKEPTVGMRVSRDKALKSSLNINASTYVPKPYLPSESEYGRSSRKVVSTGSHPHAQRQRHNIRSTYSRTKQNNGNINFKIDIDRIRTGYDQRTSLMIRNIPNKYTQQEFINEINSHRELRDKFDFFYLPIDFKNKCNIGYCFLNVGSCVDIVDFYQIFNNRVWTKYNSDKVCLISYAKIQGKESLVNRFKNSSLMKKHYEFRPLLFYSHGPMKGKSQPFPIE